MDKEACTKIPPAFDECGDGSNDDNNGVGSNGGNGTTCFDGVCAEIRNGVLCPVSNPRSPWSMTDTPEDVCLQDSYIDEQLNISGADVNVYKLLGIHEQGKLVDLTGDGNAISGGSHPNFPATDAFDLFNTEWRSLQLGSNVVTGAFIGYDFGEIRLDNGRLRYGIETFIKHNITRVRIKQGCNPLNRATKVRLERSADGERWFGSGISNVSDCDGMVTLDFPSSSPARYWRVRPIEFNGGDTDYWSVRALQLIDYEKTDIDNIQDKVYMENRDMSYSEFPEKLKGSYNPLDSQSFVAKMALYGGGSGELYFIEFSWSAIIRALGRPMVVGDILQLPSETQYSATLQPVLKYVTVTDVGWSPTGYSPQWVPLMVRIVAEPSIASPETQDVFGKLDQDYDDTGLSDVGDGVNNKKYIDISDIDHTIAAKANTMVPERGDDTANVAKLSDDVYDWAEAHPGVDVSKIDRRRTRWSRDGMPPNGEPYTQADEFPPNPSNGDWHRLTYTLIRQGIPPRLYRYSGDKGKWIYMETDSRAYNQVIRRRLQEFNDPNTSTVTRPDEIDEEFKK